MSDLSLKLIVQTNPVPIIRFGLASYRVTTLVTLNGIELYQDISHVRDSGKPREIDPAASRLAARLSVALGIPADIIKLEV